ncbi:MAG: hypothetical protein FJZ38_11760 [Candidatus Rokubacteria bacterium]|nr:hypothetical protein [Candidatus Rokubacteria bacterium]
MKLITAHRILIAAGIAFFLFYALLQARIYVVRDGGLGAMLQAGGAVAVAVGLTIYYRSLRHWGRR